jgi:hypothetical protein
MNLTWQTFNFGTYTNIGDADDLKTAFTKTDNNLNYLKERLNAFYNTDTNGNTLMIVDGYDVKIKTIETANSNTTITTTDDSVILNVKDSINSLNEDSNPTLSANLNVNGFEIFNKDGNSEYKNLKLNELFVSTIDGETELYSGNTLSFVSDATIKIKSNIDAAGKSFQCSVINTNEIRSSNIYSPMMYGDVIGNVIGNFTGMSTGHHDGTVTGNVTGTVSDISNHDITGLSNVSANIPVYDQLLVWDGVEYVPTSINELTTKYPLRLPQLTINDIPTLSPVDGDMIYNASTKKFQGYSDGNWVDLH